jgi:hypothetical protein
VWCRLTHSSFEAWKKVKFTKRNTKATNLNLKYNDRVSIKQEKYNDLMKLCKKGLIQSPEAREFFSQLKHEHSASVQADEPDVGDAILDYVD